MMAVAYSEPRRGKVLFSKQADTYTSVFIICSGIVAMQIPAFYTGNRNYPASLARLEFQTGF